MDILWIVQATGDRTGGRYSVVEQYMPEGSGPPPHAHAFEDETLWVMEGEMTVEVGSETPVLGSGTMGHVPRNTVHSFRVTKGVCYVLNSYTPAGFEQATIGCSRPAESRSLPPVRLDPLDSPQIAQFFNNDRIAPAERPWAVQRLERS